MPHRSVRGDFVARQRHEAFIRHCLFIGFCVVISLPLLLAISPGIGLTASAALLLIAAQASAGLFVAVTGWLTIGQVLVVATLSLVVGQLSHEPAISLYPIVLLLLVLIIEVVSAGSFIAVFSSVFAMAAVLTLLTGGVDVALHVHELVTGRVAFNAESGLFMGLGFLIFLSQIARGLCFDQAIRDRLSGQKTDLDVPSEAELPDPVVLLDPDGQVTYVSTAARQSLGLRAEDLTKRGFFNRLQISDRPLFLKALACALDEGEATVDLRFKVDEGGDQEATTYRWYEMHLARRTPIATVKPHSVTKIIARDDMPAPLIGVLRDSEARHAKEAAHLDAQHQAEAYARSKSEFVALATHELRTPLNSIIGFSEILQSELYGKFEYAKHREYADIIHRSGQHLLQLVNAVLDVSRLETGQFEISPEAIDVEDLIKDCCEMVAQEADKQHVSVEFIPCETGNRQLYADPLACRQILLNLLHNAIKFSKTGGQVSVSTQRSEGKMVIQIRDNGIGIAPETLLKIGRPFVQADKSFNRVHQGTGLGLAMVRGLVDLHHGGFDIQSAVGRGTTVRVTLPICDGMAAAQTDQSDRVVDLDTRRRALSA